MIINKQRVLCFFALYLLKRNSRWIINDNQSILLIFYLIMIFQTFLIWTILYIINFFQLSKELTITFFLLLFWFFENSATVHFLLQFWLLKIQRQRIFYYDFDFLKIQRQCIFCYNSDLLKIQRQCIFYYNFNLLKILTTAHFLNDLFLNLKFLILFNLTMLCKFLFIILCLPLDNLMYTKFLIISNLDFHFLDHAMFFHF